MVKQNTFSSISDSSCITELYGYGQYLLAREEKQALQLVKGAASETAIGRPVTRGQLVACRLWFMDPSPGGSTLWTTCRIGFELPHLTLFFCRQMLPSRSRFGEDI
ncbi:hypothetical protein TNCV_2516281 [Trichonephila clavipes]|nr:hypothetical protein TNCV_2516281 [Trichonephila clavipes]